jgi:hypothetical protein
MTTTPPPNPASGSGPAGPAVTPGPAPTPDAAWLRQATMLILRRPELWATAIGQVRRLAPPGWWRRKPHLPLPDPAYLQFRMETQYGSDHDLEAADVVTYLHWVRAENRSR